MLCRMPNATGSTTLDLSLEDRQAMIDATILYCWAIDTRSYTDLNDVFTEDVHCEYSSVAPAFTGVPALIELVSATLDPLDGSQHMLTNHQFEASENGPRSRCYFHAQHIRRAAEGGSNYLVAGIYSDRWRKTSAGWRSCHRTLEVLWTDGNPRVVGS
jgi:hypothetical protein